MAALQCTGLQQRVAHALGARKSGRNAARRVTVCAADRPMWLPGSPPAKTLDGSYPAE